VVVGGSVSSDLIVVTQGNTPDPHCKEEVWMWSNYSIYTMFLQLWAHNT